MGTPPVPSRTRTVRRAPRRLLIVALAAAALALPSSALGAAWVPGPTITPANGFTASVVKDGLPSGGSPVAALGVLSGSTPLAQASELTAGAWSAPDQLSAITLAQFVDPSGGILAFTSTTSCNLACSTVLSSRYRPPGGPWGPAQGIVGGTTGFSQFHVAFGADGTAYAGWSHGAVAQFDIRGPGAGGAWAGLPESLPTLPSSRTTASLAVGVATNGEVTFLYDGFSAASNNYILYAARRDSGGTWFGPTQVHSAFSGSVNAELPAVAVDGAGNATAVWYEAQTFQTVEVETRAPGQNTWSAATQVNTGSQVGAAPAVAVATNGNATVAFVDGAACGTCPARIVKRIGAAGGWSAPQSFGNAISLSLAGAPTGPAALAYADPSNGVHAARGQLGSSLGTTTDLASGAPSAPAPAAAVDANADVLVMWTQGTAEYDSALYDNSPPVLALSAPAQATTGQQLTVSATATDNWSALTPTFDFGDGTGATGSPATHAYAQAGSYLVQVSATDAAGNSTTQQQQITVTDPPPPPTTAARGLNRPVAGKTVNLEPIQPGVLVETPGTTTFVPLVAPEQVQDGSIIDARHGRVRITIDNGVGGLDTADFYGGIFKFTQPKVKAGQIAFADLFLVFGSFSGCPTAPHNPKIASAAKSKHRSVRHLWGSGHGAFRTVGRFSSATIRGTTWETDDRCDGTLTKVTSGKVGVRDFVKRKTVVVKAHHSYFAAPKKHK